MAHLQKSNVFEISSLTVYNIQSNKEKNFKFYANTVSNREITN